MYTPTFTLSYQHKELLNALKEKDYERDILAKKLVYPRTTVFDYLVDLERLGVVYREKLMIKKKGRPKTFWKLRLEKYQELNGTDQLYFTEEIHRIHVSVKKKKETRQ